MANVWTVSKSIDFMKTTQDVGNISQTLILRCQRPELNKHIIVIPLVLVVLGQLITKMISKYAAQLTSNNAVHTAFDGE